MKRVLIEEMHSEEIGAAVDRALREVAAEYEAGTLDLSGRYYSEEELAEMRAAKESSLPVEPGTAA